MKYPIARVKWRDSATTRGWRSKDEGGISVIESIGFLLRSTKDVVVLTTSIDEGGGVLDPIAIPRSAIQKLTYRKRKHAARRKV